MSLTVAPAAIWHLWFHPHWFHMFVLPDWPPKGTCLPGSGLGELVPGCPGRKCQGFVISNQRRREFSDAFSCRVRAPPGLAQMWLHGGPDLLLWGAERASQGPCCDQPWGSGCREGHQSGQRDSGSSRRPTARPPACPVSFFFFPSLNPEKLLASSSPVKHGV